MSHGSARNSGGHNKVLVLEGLRPGSERPSGQRDRRSNETIGAERSNFRVSHTNHGNSNLPQKSPYVGNVEMLYEGSARASKTLDADTAANPSPRAAPTSNTVLTSEDQGSTAQDPKTAYSNSIRAGSRTALENVGKGPEVGARQAWARQGPLNT